MGRYTYRRISAFIIDIMLVLIISTMFSSISYVNPLVDDYQKSYQEYQELINSEDEILTNKESLKEINNYAKLFGKYLYKLDYTMLFNNIYYLIFYFLYFVIFAYFTNGQTLGKKIFKLKIVNSYDKKVSFKNLSIRSLLNGSSFFFGVNIIIIIQLLLLFIKNYQVYFYINMFVTLLSFIIELISLILLISNKEHCSLDDIIGKTKVVDVNV